MGRVSTASRERKTATTRDNASLVLGCYSEITALSRAMLVPASDRRMNRLVDALHEAAIRLAADAFGRLHRHRGQDRDPVQQAARASASRASRRAGELSAGRVAPRRPSALVPRRPAMNARRSEHGETKPAVPLDLESALASIGAMNIKALRKLWQQWFGDPRAALPEQGCAAPPARLACPGGTVRRAHP